MAPQINSEGEHIKKFLNNKVFNLQPRFTVTHHPVRKKFGLSHNSYAVVDSIHQLSHRPNHPWCTQSKSQIARFLDMSERQVFRAINEGLEKGLIEKNEPRGDLRTSEKWINEVVLYNPDIKKQDP